MGKIVALRSFGDNTVVSGEPSMSALADIVEELKILPPPSLARVAAYVHGLRERASRDRKAAIRATAGSLSARDAEAMEKAIEAGCERVDPNDW
jgi:hypothetical protein